MANHRREDDNSGGSSGCLLVPQKWTSTLYKVDEVAERPPWPPIWLIRDTPTTPICSDQDADVDFDGQVATMVLMRMMATLKMVTLMFTKTIVMLTEEAQPVFVQLRRHNVVTNQYNAVQYC